MWASDFWADDLWADNFWAGYALRKKGHIRRIRRLKVIEVDQPEISPEMELIDIMEEWDPPEEEKRKLLKYTPEIRALLAKYRGLKGK